MVGAILVGFFAFMLAHCRAVTFLGGAVHLPTRRDIDNRLVGGMVIHHAAERLLHEPSRRPG